MRTVTKSVLTAAVIAAGFAAAEAAAPSLEERVQERTRRLAEQRQPHTAVSVDPGQLDRYAGIYQRAPYEFFTIRREGGGLILGVEMPGIETIPRKPGESPDTELLPESATGFFAKSKPFAINFTLDAKGEVTGMVQHASGFEIPLPKVDEAVEKKALAEAAARIKAGKPRPDAEGKLRRFIEGFQRGQPNYDEMDAEAAVLYRTDFFQRYADQVRALGALKSLTFAAVTPRGEDKFVAVGENGRTDVTIDFAAGGRIDTVIMGKVEK
jgi:hypothetical protein